MGWKKVTKHLGKLMSLAAIYFTGNLVVLWIDVTVLVMIIYYTTAVLVKVYFWQHT